MLTNRSLATSFVSGLLLRLVSSVECLRVGLQVISQVHLLEMQSLIVCDRTMIFVRREIREPVSGSLRSPPKCETHAFIRRETW